MIAEKLYRQKSTNGLERIRLIPANLPEISLDEISLSTTLAGKKLEAPFFINAITGGSQTTDALNESLARVANKTGVAMSVGSQSVAVKNAAYAKGFERLRRLNPNGIMLANLGANHPFENAERACSMIDADIIEIHLNAAQELVMPEGDAEFHWLENLKRLNEKLQVPLLVKEVGTGMTPQTLKLLAENGFSYVDLAGAGGTNFAAIENERRKNKETLAFKIIRLFYAVDRAVRRSPAACAVPAESQIIHPASKNKAFENIDCVFRRSVRQFDSVNGRNRIPPNIRAVISLCFSEKRMIAVRFEQRFKLFGQALFICIRHIQECPQLFDQLACRIRFR